MERRVIERMGFLLSADLLSCTIKSMRQNVNRFRIKVDKYEYD